MTAVGKPVSEQGEDRDDRLATLDPEVRGVAVASQREHLSGQGEDDQNYGGIPRSGNTIKRGDQRPSYEDGNRKVTVVYPG